MNNNGTTIENLTRENMELKAQVNDLTERLKAVFAIDNSRNNTELLTLKHDIANALWVDYNDYKDYSSEFTQDNFEALAGACDRTFRVLKRLGINFDLD